MSKRKFSRDFKEAVLREHQEGVSFYKLGQKYDIEPSAIRRWYSAYEANGGEFLERQNADLCNYSADFKKQVVEDYLSGGSSYQTIAMKYGIHAQSTVLKWVKSYNNHDELHNSRETGGRYLMVKDIKPRKTTLEERIAIVEHCIAHANNYSLTAQEFNCSYGQVNSWVHKFNEKGIEGLYDRRGRSKPLDELDEVNRLRAENRMLKAEKKNQQMEIDFLKKLEEIERR